MANVTHTVREKGVNGDIEIQEFEQGVVKMLEIRIYGSAGGLKATLRIPRERFADALEKFWPEEAAFEFDSDKNG